MAKKITAMLLLISLLFCYSFVATAEGETQTSLTINAKSAILIDVGTGQILFEQNKDQQLAPASVTKIMTMLLTLEAVNSGQLSLDDIVTASENAKNMGGSQINLDTGEQMSVKDIMMSIAVASANDSSLAIAEHLANGSESEFVAMMNQRAQSLGMTNTNFANPHGLPQEGHVTSAYDIALMSKQLLQTPGALDFVSASTYSIRADTNEYVMRNSNKMLETYAGCIGLKTGFTDEAGYCLSAAAQRDGMTLIGVVLGAESSTIRNQEMAKLLDYGFNNFTTVEVPIQEVSIDPITVTKGVSKSVEVVIPQIEIPTQIVSKATAPNFEQIVTVEETLQAPIQEGQVVGKITIVMDSKELGVFDITAKNSVEEMTLKKSVELILKTIIST